MGPQGLESLPAKGGLTLQPKLHYESKETVEIECGNLFVRELKK